MIAVIQSITQAPSAIEVGAAVSFADGPAMGANGFLKAFISHEVGATDAKASKSDPDSKQHPLEELDNVEKSDTADTPASGETAILPPIAQFFATLPLPPEQSLGSSPETETGNLPAQAAVGAVGAQNVAPEAANILGKTLSDLAAKPGFDPSLKSDVRSDKWDAAASQQPTGQEQLGAPDAPNGAGSVSNSAKALQVSASTSFASPNAADPNKTVTVGEVADVLRATDLQDGAIEPGHVRLFDPRAQAEPGMKALATDVKTDVAIAKYPSTISSAETAWRQKWVANEAAAPANDSPTAAHTRAPSDGAATDQAGQSVTLVSPLSDAGQAKPTQGSPTTSSIDPVVSAASTAKLPKSTPPITQVDDDSNDDLPPVDSAESGAERALAAVDQPDFGAQVAAPRQSAIGALPSASGPVLASLPAAIAPTLVKMAKTRDNGPLELALSPEELGRLTISIKQDGHYVHVTLTAERPETLDLMRRHGTDLVADLRQAGFTGASLSFGQSGQDQPPRFARATPDDKHQPPQQNPRPEITPTAPSQPNTGSGVDLRL